MVDTKIKDLDEKVIGVATDEFVINDVTTGNTDKKMGMDGLRITESQITDLQSYLLNITGEPISDLSDVIITAVASGELLKFDGTDWINNTLAEAGISATGHTHVLTAGATDVTITATNLNILDDGIDTTLHFHDADRARANHTGTQLLSTISDVSITSTNLNILDDGVDTTLHFHDSDRARANHTGTQLASTVSDFDTQVRISRLDQMATPTVSVSFGNQLITNLLDPVSIQDAATKNYVDAIAINGVKWKESARVASTGNLTLSAEQTIDGVLTSTDRILVKDQTTSSQNGIYVTDAGAWIRSTDADTGAEILQMAIFIEEGTTNADQGFVLTTNAPIVIDTTALSYTQFTGLGQITAGAGLTKTANVLDVIGTTNRISVLADSVDIASTYVGQTSIITLGTITTGTWEGTTVAVLQGGTGVTTSTGTTNVVLSDSPTIITPTIASFVNSTHDHSNAAGGGNLTNTALTTGIFAAITGLGVQTQAFDMDGNDIILDAAGNIRIHSSVANVTKLKHSTNFPNFALLRDQIVADGSTAGKVSFRSKDDGDNERIFGEIRTIIEDTTVAGNLVHGSLHIRVRDANVETTYISFNDAKSGQIDILKPTLFADVNVTIKDNRLLIESPDGLTPVTVINSQQTLARNLTIPILTGNRDVVVTTETSQIVIGTEVTGASTALTDTADITYLNTSNTYATNTIQTFTPDASNAGINVGSFAGEPTGANGEIVYDSTANQMKGFINGAWVDLGAGAGGGESNTISSLGGGTVLTAATPKSGVDLRTVSIATTAPITHSVTTDLMTFDINDLVDADMGVHTSTKITITAKGQLNSSISYEDEANTWGAFNQNISSGGKWQEAGVNISPIGTHDVWIGAGSMWESTTNGSAALTKVEIASGVDINTLDFVSTSVKSAQFEVSLPRNYDNGTITYTVYWSSTATDTDGVTWGLEAVAISDNVAINTAYGTRIDIDDANQSAASEVLITAESAALTIGNTPADSDLVRFKLTRQTEDVNDTATEDTRLHGIMFHITTDAATAT